MDDITIFNLRAVNKGALNATVSIRLGNGLTIHDCKIIQQDGVLSAKLPQRPERQKGGEVVYHDLVDFADPKTWPAIALQLVAYYQAANEKAQSPDPENPASEDISRQEEDQSQPTPEPDIQAILTILGRRPRWYGKGEDRSLDLRGTDIRGADLHGAHLEEAKLYDTHLEGVDLSYVIGLTLEQLADAYTDENTRFPDYLTSSQATDDEDT
jgi:DNA-binding cell septation regulator SpoVG